MIPLSSKESVEYKDPSDGIVFKFKPKNGLLEREQSDIWEASDDPKAGAKKLDILIDKILIEPKYDIPASDKLNTEEKLIVLRFWNEANKLTKEEKKS